MKAIIRKLFSGKRILILLVCFLLVSIGTFNGKAEENKPLTADKIYEITSESVFYLRVFTEDGSLKTVGTGFIIGEDKILTAYHVINEGKSFEAVFDDGKTVKDISVIKSDKEKDLALLDIKLKDNFIFSKAVNFSSDEVKYGEKVFALGYPMKNTKIITEGIINSPKVKLNGDDVMFISSQVASGMSGGPIIDEYGNLKGLISGSMRNMTNINIGISIADIKNFVGGK
jgi:S1-C subfamily serine protease